MNRTELEEIIKSCDVNIAKLELAKSEAAKELEKKDEVPEYYSVENGNEIYFVNYNGEVYSDGFFPEHTKDKTANKRHRAFKTKKIAELFAQKTQVIADQLYFKELYDANFVPDWSDGCGLKFYIVYNNSSYPKTYFVDNCCGCASGETVYFSSYEIAKKCAGWLNSKISNK